MSGIRCPKCGKTEHSFWEGFLRPTYTSLRCPSCDIRLELVNAGTCHFISGIIFAFILVILFLVEPPLMLALIILSGFICWFVDVFIVWLLGRWSEWSYELSELVKLRWLSAANSISTIIAGVWVFFMAKMLVIPYWKIADDLEQLEVLKEHYDQMFGPAGIIGIIIGLISIATSGTTSLAKGKLRRQSIEKSLSQKILKD